MREWPEIRPKNLLLTQQTLVKKERIPGLNVSLFLGACKLSNSIRTARYKVVFNNIVKT